MTNETLKPCPHCGSDDLSGPHFDEYLGDSTAPHWWIDCNICPCSMTVWEREKEHFLEAWNLRSSQTRTAVYSKHVTKDIASDDLYGLVNCTLYLRSEQQGKDVPSSHYISSGSFEEMKRLFVVSFKSSPEYFIQLEDGRQYPNDFILDNTGDDNEQK